MNARTAMTAAGLIAGSLITVIASGRTVGPTEREKALASLIEAERAFSRTSEEKGIREAFLTWLAPDAVVFRPSPVPGRPVYEKMDPANPAVLTWEPEFAEVAASGELGYTTGPYTVRPRRDAEPSGFGHYVSIWRTQPDGTWKVILDIGIPHGHPAAAARPISSPAPSAPSRPLSPEALRDAEYAFGISAGTFEKEIADKGTRIALAAFATEDVRVLRPELFPAIGSSAAKALVPADEGKIGRAGANPPKMSFKVGMAWSGDMAYSYGTVGPGQPGGPGQEAAFLKIWRRAEAGVYKVCLDIRLPIPADAGR
jgi:ketosteroid isomerase-like protein